MPVEATPTSSATSQPSSAAKECNTYATLAELKTRLNITVTTYDGELLDVLRAASREVEQAAGRYFYTETGTRYLDSRTTGPIVIDDCLALTAVTADSELDDTFDGETWVSGTDYYLWPEVGYPKTELRVLRNRDYSPAARKRYLKLVGTWGAGNLQDSSPWATLDGTATVADGTSTSLTLAGNVAPVAGQTIKLEDEQLFITAVNGSTATVVRGVNGTTGAAHSAVAISLAQYPSDVIRATLWCAALMWRDFERGGLQSERIGDYSYTRGSADADGQTLRRLLGRVTRWAV